jgi:thiol-disulfide isomerase/thioredoxin
MLTRQLPTPVVVAVLAVTLATVLWLIGSRFPNAGNGAPVLTRASGPAPPIAGDSVQGDTFRLSDHRNKVVLVNFWATWCGPCRREIPELIRLQERFGPRGFTVVGVSLDENSGTATRVRPFVDEHKINYPVLLAPPGVQDAYGGVPAIPATFLIDKQGNLAGQVEGLAQEEQLAPVIERLLSSS